MHEWDEVAEACVAFAKTDDQAAIGDALTLLRGDLEGGIAGDLVISSLLREEHLRTEQKALILAFALHLYEPTRELASRAFLHQPPGDLTLVYTSALASLADACTPFTDMGRDIGPSPCGELCHFMDYEVFQRYIAVDRPLASRYSGVGLSFKGVIQRRLPVRSRRVLSALSGTLRDRVFSTLSTWLDAYNQSGAGVAALARDMLGCPHFEGKELVELRFSEASVRARTLKKPTFADARAYPPFLPSRQMDPYGTARNLSDSSQPGGPEVWNSGALETVQGIRMIGQPAGMLVGLWRDFVRGGNRN